VNRVETGEHRIEASIAALFCRCPALCGFTVQHTSALGELIDECPEAGELLRERTFARVFH
jgi:hypothetical protein